MPMHANKVLANNVGCPEWCSGAVVFSTVAPTVTRTYFPSIPEGQLEVSLPVVVLALICYGIAEILTTNT